MQDAKAVANFFILRAQADKVRDLNPKKLQDLVYCAHGWCLGITGKPLIKSQILSARNGPEIPDLAEAVAGYGTKQVTEPLGEVVRGADEKMQFHAPSVPAGGSAEKVLLITWKAYGKLSTYDLSRVTQAPGGPWDQIWNDPDRTSRFAAEMDNATIQVWFRQLAERNRRRTRARSVEDTQRIIVQPDPDQLRSV